jgi:ABC-type nitrate/sulfonate/bicarbonate transport system permease component
MATEKTMLATIIGLFLATIIGLFLATIIGLFAVFATEYVEL